MCRCPEDVANLDESVQHPAHTVKPPTDLVFTSISSKYLHLPEQIWIHNLITEQTLGTGAFREREKMLPVSDLIITEAIATQCDEEDS